MKPSKNNKLKSILQAKVSQSINEMRKQIASSLLKEEAPSASKTYELDSLGGFPIAVSWMDPSNPNSVSIQLPSIPRFKIDDQWVGNKRQRDGGTIKVAANEIAIGIEKALGTTKSEWTNDLRRKLRHDIASILILFTGNA